MCPPRLFQFLSASCRLAPGLRCSLFVVLARPTGETFKLVTLVKQDNVIVLSSCLLSISPHFSCKPLPLYPPSLGLTQSWWLPSWLYLCMLHTFFYYCSPSRLCSHHLLSQLMPLLKFYMVMFGVKLGTFIHHGSLKHFFQQNSKKGQPMVLFFFRLSFMS
jgi:hypothetical protein